MSGRFRYGLQPLLLTRGWEVDALRRDLADANAAVAAQQARVDELSQRLLRADQEWRSRTGADDLSVDQFARFVRYRADLSEKLALQERLLQERQAERDGMVERLIGAQRSLEAVEEHRDAAKAQFVQQRVNMEMKMADDQWGVVQAGRTNDVD